MVLITVIWSLPSEHSLGLNCEAPAARPNVLGSKYHYAHVDSGIDLPEDDIFFVTAERYPLAI